VVEEDLVDGVEVEAGAGVEVGLMVIEISVTDTIGIQALRGEVAVGVDTTREFEVMIQALRGEVAVGVDTPGKLEVVIQALRAGVMVTEKEGARIEKVL
jgi:hypothetical protein